MLLALMSVLMDSTKSQPENVLPAPLSALLVMDMPPTVLLASMDQFQSTEPALSNAEKTNSASKASALPALRAATAAPTLLKTASNALLAMSKLDQSAKKDVFLTNSSMPTKEDVLPADQDAPLALPITTAPAVRMLLSHPEEESALTALILVPLVMEPEPAPHA